MINKMDWMNKLNAYPVVNQKYSRRMLEMRRIAQTSMLKEPRDLVFLMSLSWEM